MCRAMKQRLETQRVKTNTIDLAALRPPADTPEWPRFRDMRAVKASRSRFWIFQCGWRRERAHRGSKTEMLTPKGEHLFPPVLTGVMFDGRISFDGIATVKTL